MKKFLDYIYHKLGYTTPKTYTSSPIEYCPLDFDEEVRIYIPNNVCDKKGLETLLTHLRRAHQNYDSISADLGTHFIEQKSYRVLLATKKKELDEEPTPEEKK